MLQAKITSHSNGSCRVTLCSCCHLVDSIADRLEYWKTYKKSRTTQARATLGLFSSVMASDIFKGFLMVLTK